MRVARARGTTLMEMMVFGTIASIVLVTMIGLLSRSGKLLELGRRTSGTLGDLKILLETMSEDAAELLYFEGTGAPYDSTSNPGTFAFVIRSSRVESGLVPVPIGITGLIEVNTTSTTAMTGGGGLRRIEYSVSGTDTLRDCIRTVTPLADTLQPAGTPVSRHIVRNGILGLRICPLAAVLQSGAYRITLANDPQARTAGATPACLVVDVSAGQQTPGPTTLDSSPVSSLVTKLWCRNRVMEIPRGVLR